MSSEHLLQLSRSNTSTSLSRLHEPSTIVEDHSQLRDDSGENYKEEGHLTQTILIFIWLIGLSVIMGFDVTYKMNKFDIRLDKLQATTGKQLKLSTLDVPLISYFIARLIKAENNTRNLAHQLIELRSQLDGRIFDLKGDLQMSKPLFVDTGRQCADQTSDLQLLVKELEERISKIEHLQSLIPSEIRSPALATFFKMLHAHSKAGRSFVDVVNQIIENSLIKYSKDRIGKRDHALYSNGARILWHHTTNHGYPNIWRGVLTSIPVVSYFVTSTAVSGPELALLPELTLDKCWNFNGSSGQLAVTLPGPLQITEISIDHTAKELGSDWTVAPKNFSVWGRVESLINLEAYSGFMSTLIRNVAYPYTCFMQKSTVSRLTGLLPSCHTQWITPYGSICHRLNLTCAFLPTYRHFQYLVRY
jgi:hypothetical protein